MFTITCRYKSALLNGANFQYMTTVIFADTSIPTVQINQLLQCSVEWLTSPFYHLPASVTLWIFNRQKTRTLSTETSILIHPSVSSVRIRIFHRPHLKIHLVFETPSAKILQKITKPIPHLPCEETYRHFQIVNSK